MKYISRHFAILYGTNDYLFADRRLAIGLLAARKPDPYRHHRYRVGFAISWDWLPKIGWLDERYEPEGYPSSRWTGRRERLFSWSWLFHFDGRVERI